MNKKSATALNVITAFEIYKDLLTTNWCVCRAPSHEYYITGDCPLVCFVLKENGKAMFGAGFRLPNVEVSFPLTPEICLYLDRRHTQNYRAISKNFIREIHNKSFK
jgi:hypothetical protein